MPFENQYSVSDLVFGISAKALQHRDRLQLSCQHVHSSLFELFLFFGFVKKNHTHWGPEYEICVFTPIVLESFGNC